MGKLEEHQEYLDLLEQAKITKTTLDKLVTAIQAGNRNLDEIVDNYLLREQLRKASREKAQTTLDEVKQ